MGWAAGSNAALKDQIEKVTDSSSSVKDNTLATVDRVYNNAQTSVLDRHEKNALNGDGMKQSWFKTVLELLGLGGGRARETQNLVPAARQRVAYIDEPGSEGVKALGNGKFFINRNGINKC